MTRPIITDDQADGMDDMGSWAVCSGACMQGDKQCPCPEACHISKERLGPIGPFQRWVLLHPVSVAVLCALAAVGIVWMSK